MACGTPVVAMPCGAAPEVVVDGETGYLVPPEDPEALAERISELCADPLLARRMGEAGRKRVEDHFSWSSIARQTVRLYERLCAPRA